MIFQSEFLEEFDGHLLLPGRAGEYLQMRCHQISYVRKKADYRGILPRLRLGILKVSKDGLAIECRSLGNQQTFLTPYIKKLAPQNKLKSSAFPP